MNGPRLSEPDRESRSQPEYSAPALLACGERAVLVELATLDHAVALSARLGWLRSAGREDIWRHVEDVVPGLSTVLVILGPDGDLAGLRRALAIEVANLTLERVQAAAGVRGGPGMPGGDDKAVIIGVRYDGPDLEHVAAVTGLSVPAVIAAHTGTPWLVACMGFAPGFGYLISGESRLELPRRDTPRTAVPAGAVALAGRYSGIYPRSSPGGWHLIGTTDTRLWDIERDPPALLQPAMVVRFVDLDAATTTPTTPTAATTAAASTATDARANAPGSAA